jgi:hypothetical protein
VLHQRPAWYHRQRPAPVLQKQVLQPLRLPRLRPLRVRSPRVLQLVLREERLDASMYFLAGARSRCRA